jgi:PAS domain S-box-containing protein
VRLGEHVRFESVRMRRGGTPVDVSVAVGPVISKNGWVVGASAIIRDVSERKRTEQKLVETLALLMQTNNQRKLALSAGGMGTFEVDLERDAITWSDEIYAQAGIDRTNDVLSTAEVECFIHPDDLEQTRARRAEAFAAGGSYQSEFRVVRPSGEVRWIYVRAQALPVGGEATKVYGVSIDVTERKEREAHIRFLLSEVSHRSKNMLAVVQAIAAQTARSTSSPVDFAGDFSARLKSLAASLDLLVQQEWRGVSAKGLVESQLGHYANLAEQRVSVDGPDLMLNPLAAQYLGMALHELSTNAVKYGALSDPAGNIAIAWRVATDGSGRRFHMSWQESGGPAVQPPTRTGFGKLVTERMAAEALHGEVKLEFRPAGVYWAIDADASATLKDTQGAASRTDAIFKQKSPVQGEKTRGD